MLFVCNIILRNHEVTIENNLDVIIEEAFILLLISRKKNSWQKVRALTEKGLQ